jgi:hypothetical protein
MTKSKGKKTMTEKAIAANQANAQKSGGPNDTTNCAHNAVTHGMDGVTPLYPWENREEYIAWCQGWVDYAKPQGPIELALVLEAAHAHWCQFRADRYEFSLVSEAPSRCDGAAHMQRMSSLKTQLSRQRRMALSDFEKMKAARIRGETVNLPPPTTPGVTLPEIAYAVFFPETTPAEVFPEGLPYEAPRPSSAEVAQEARDLKIRVQRMIPKDTDEEHYPQYMYCDYITKEDRRFGLNGYLQTLKSQMPRSTAFPLTDADIEALVEKAASEPEPEPDPEELDPFVLALESLPNPGESEFGRTFYRRTGLLPRLAHCYPLNFLTPEAYPEKMGSFPIFLRPKEPAPTYSEDCAPWRPKNPESPESDPPEKG